MRVRALLPRLVYGVYGAAGTASNPVAGRVRYRCDFLAQPYGPRGTGAICDARVALDPAACARPDYDSRNEIRVLHSLCPNSVGWGNGGGLCVRSNCAPASGGAAKADL